MFGFTVDEFRGLVNSTMVVAALSERAIFKISHQIFSLMALSEDDPPCIIVLQTLSKFFDTDLFVLHMSSWISTESIYKTIAEIKDSGFTSSMILSFPEPQSVVFTFEASDGRSMDYGLRLLTPHEEMYAIDERQIDYLTFVSINSEEFRNIIELFAESAYVYVTLTNSEVQFSGENLDVILTHHAKKRHCIIVGVVASQELRFRIILNPSGTFFNLIFQSKMVWLSKLNHSSKGVVIAPTGLYTRFFSYSP